MNCNKTSFPLQPLTPDLAPTRGERKLGPLLIGPVVVDPPLLQAPMAGFTNYAYRQILRKFGGVGLPATEMLTRGACWESTPGAVFRNACGA